MPEKDMADDESRRGQALFEAGRAEGFDAGRREGEKAGLREGRIQSLEIVVKQLAEEVKALKSITASNSTNFKIAMAMLYAAIAMVQFLPTIRGLLNVP
jgi:flagellar biosynthesis/type III secretory pathway protein FliH